MNKLVKNALKKTYPVKWFLGKINNLSQAQMDLAKTQKDLVQAQKDLDKAQKELLSRTVQLEKQIQALKQQDINLRREMNYLYYKGLHPDQYAENLKEWYKERTGKTLDLEHPKTYNEKIQWMKLYDSTPLKTKLADKYLVRDWVSEKIGSQYLIPLLGVYDKFDDIDFDKLPDKFVIKTNHSCASNWIVPNKSQLNINGARNFFKSKMRENFAFRYGLELHYKDIIPKIIIEEYIDNGGNNLYDYKFFCFNGKTRFIMFLTDRKIGLKMAFFDCKWNRLPVVYSYPRYEGVVEKPSNLEDMISIAEKLAEGFSHVRVDLYRLNDGSIKFGEMTFTSASGTCKWDPEEYDRIFGDLIDLPTDHS